MADFRQLPICDLPVLQPLFESVFRVDFNLALMQWKYADGKGESWVVGQDDSGPSVHCGLAFRWVIFRGVTVRAAQLVDLMARPKEAGLSRRDSPFARLMLHLLDRLPTVDNPDGLAFGFPSDRAMRLGEHVGVYRAVDRLFELTLLPEHGFHLPAWRSWQPEQLSDQRLAESFWQALRDDLHHSALGVRDLDYLRWRYVHHPEKTYHLLIAQSRWRKKPFGLAIVSPSTDGNFELLDVLAAWRDFPQVLRALQGWLAAQDGRQLRFSLTAGFARQLAPFAAQCAPTEFRIMANPRGAPAMLSAIDGNWWLTGGDTDYR